MASDEAPNQFADEELLPSDPADDSQATTAVTHSENFAPDFVVDSSTDQASDAPLPSFDPAEDPSKGFQSVDPPIPSEVVDFGAAGSEKPKVEETPEAQKPRREFFLIRVPRPNLSDIINLIKAAEQKLKEKKEKQQFINAALNLKKAARSEALANLKQAREKSRACMNEIQAKFEEIKPLQEAIRRFQDVNSVVRNRTRELQCSSEYELDLKLAEMEFRLQHESLTLNEEKKLLRDMKTLQNSRAEIKETEALSISVSDSQGHKEAIQARLKPLLAEVEIMKMERDAARKICESFAAEYKTIEKNVDDLFAERAKAIQEHDDAYHELQQLRKEYSLQEQEFRQNGQELLKFRQLAAENNVKGLEEFCNEQLERIHEKLNSDKEYRKKYYKDMEFSVIRRFGSLDTRRPNLEEENALKQALNESKSRASLSPAVGDISTEAKSSKDSAKASKDHSAKDHSDELGSQVRKPNSGKGKPVAEKKGGEGKQNSEAMQEEAKEKVKTEEELAEEKRLKEKRREEEMAKAKEAEERKRRLKEKAQKRAEIRAQKEAEELALKKEKEKERKSRRLAEKAKEKERKAAEDEKREEEEAEAEKGDEESKTEKEGKDGDQETNLSELTRRQRKRLAHERSKSSPPSSLPSALPKKKKKVYDNYLLIFLFASVLSALAFVYFYFMKRTVTASV